MSKFLKIDVAIVDNQNIVDYDRICINSDFIMGFAAEGVIEKYAVLDHFTDLKLGAMLLLNDDGVDVVDSLCERLEEEKLNPPLVGYGKGDRYVAAYNTVEDILAQLNGVFVKEGDF
ncbi:TPA: hypothetical protein ACPJIH_001151 [Haemophilus influenzae]